MDDIITALQNTPVPTILIVGGLVFLFLAIVGQFVGEINVPKERQKWAGLIGTLLLVSGVVLYAAPVPPSVLTPTTGAAVVPNTPTSMPVIIPPGAPTKKPIDTPISEPTGTPIPKPLPTGGSELLEDDFEDPSYDGDFNRNKWERLQNSPGSLIVQEDGVLKMSSKEHFSMRANVDPIVHPPFSMQARFMTNLVYPGNNLFIFVQDIGTQDYADCDLSTVTGKGEQIIVCNYVKPPIQGHDLEHKYKSDVHLFEPGSWHTVCIEVTEELRFNYYLDGNEIGSYLPDNTARLRENGYFIFDIGISITNPPDDPMIGYFDDVRITHGGCSR